MATRIIGDEALKRKMQRLGNLDFLRGHVQAGAEHIAGKMKKYPDSTAANLPNAQGRWYERGWGSRWRRKDGSIGGRQTSEDLGLSWKSKALSNTRAQAGNDASYAPHVQGPNQSRVMQEIGWKTTDMIAEEESEKILRDIQKAVDAELAR